MQPVYESAFSVGAAHRHGWKAQLSWQVPAVLLVQEACGWSKALLATCPGCGVVLEGPAPPLWVSCSSPVPCQPCLLSHFDLSPRAIKCPCLLPLQRVSVLDLQCSCTSGGMAHFLCVFLNTGDTLVLSDALEIAEDLVWYAKTIMSSGFFPLQPRLLNFVYGYPKWLQLFDLLNIIWTGHDLFFLSSLLRASLKPIS